MKKAHDTKMKKAHETKMITACPPAHARRFDVAVPVTDEKRPDGSGHYLSEGCTRTYIPSDGEEDE